MKTKPNPDEFYRLLAQSKERLKELNAINSVINIIKENRPIPETLHRICFILPDAWQYPEFTMARVKYGQYEFQTHGFKETPWCQRQGFETIDGVYGAIEIFYTKEFQEEHEGPFLKEERDLITNIANILEGYINSIKGRDAIKEKVAPKKKLEQAESHNKKLLQRFINQHNADRDIYHDLMPFKVQEILLISTLYDAYSIEREDRLTDNILGEYSKLSLSSVPRITGVSSLDEAIEKLEERYFNLIIIMMGADTVTPLKMASRIKGEYKHIPLYLLVNNSYIVNEIEKNPTTIEGVDKIFVWNGEPKIFFSMIKLLEDKVNIENDTRIALTRAILLVEDSPKYYSRYLPLLYGSVLDQTKRVIEDVRTDDLYKVLRIRIRPKILLAGTYEEAIELINRYKDYLLCIISDVKFYRKGKLDDNAGVELIGQARQLLPDLPIILQSFEKSNEAIAHKLKAAFLDKNSESLMNDIKNFLSNYLGFGDFVFKDSEGTPIAIATSMEEFENALRIIPDESLLYHAQKNHFSMWLAARGEIQVARIIHPSKIDDFSGPSEIREYLLSTLKKYRQEKKRGKIVSFDSNWEVDSSNIVSLADGSIGGKGRGLAFINTLIYTFDISQYTPNINLLTPRTSIIGTNEFECFMERNNLYEKVFTCKNYEELQVYFLKAEISDQLKLRLDRLLQIYHRPLAIRSSGMLEDSVMQPFAGVFETYMIPNSHPDRSERLKRLTDAIKLVYASVFSPTSRAYIKAMNLRVEDEKMAVIVQEVVGSKYDNYYYPNISGVAQSHNYYPFGHINPEDGFANIAIGLGKHVVEGGRSYRFCPKYPTLINYTMEDLIKNSQVDFLAVDLTKNDYNLLSGDEAGLKRLDLYDAEKHGNLKHCASVYSSENSSLIPGIGQPGPRVVNFANILKYNYIPLAQTIDVILDIVEEALGSPCEIEFAVDLNRDKNYKASFFLLQIKPLMASAQEYKLDINLIDPNKLIILSNNSMGNGHITSIQDVVYIKQKAFNKSMTLEMAKEVEEINAKLEDDDKQYVLIGPGRWGTRDRWIGIPVVWSQICNAKVIVETSFDDFPLDASYGSHFFHNVISMNVGYCSVPNNDSFSKISWEMLDSLPAITEKRFFRHVRFPKPIDIKMDGTKRLLAITLND
ncbi:PEP/pyruvate-binding domain-containing protein [Tenuifilum thalassicum]|uniref:Pyruvate, phosphate dikinase n=1 Tax=Tenuifilum thalassicum TaxID=2590900 RepID=A0A7D4CHC7_9BACT|nr:PEP/pyruvate-binding domain-containing protein [Tenuifilum thalassicum]QKG80466.1 pyruvate, phosphate dikinase [Tenuifilum thalassicum]